MKLTQKLLGVASLAIASVSIAQTTTTTSTAATLLGVQYVEASFEYINLNHDNRGVYVPSITVNAPISSNLDLSVNYARLSRENDDSIYRNDLGANLTGYLTEGALRPFVTGGLGYHWESNKFGGNNYFAWNAGAGVEYSFNTTTAVTLSANYNDSVFERNDHQYTGNGRVNHWFTNAIAGTVGVTWYEAGTFGYSASVLFKF